MRLIFSTTLLGLAWFAAVNLVMSALVWCAWRAVSARLPALPGSVLFALRLLPSATALAFAIAVFGPAHVRYEPAQTDERFGVTIVVLAALGLWLSARTVWRAGVVAAAARAAGRWPAVRVAPNAADAYEVAGFPGVSLAGVFRPRILIGAAARRGLTADELDLAIAHERAHRRSFDNLKRCLIFCAPDFFGGSAEARSLDAHWRAQAEREADRQAVAGDERRAVHLASALLKVARPEHAGPRLPPSPLWSRFNEPALLEERVRALLADPAVHASQRPGSSRAVLLLVAAAAVTAWLIHAPYDVHSLTETFVVALP